MITLIRMPGSRRGGFATVVVAHCSKTSHYDALAFVVGIDATIPLRRSFSKCWAGTEPSKRGLALSDERFGICL